MDIETIRNKFKKNEYSILTHAFIEARKDGITLDNIEFIVFNGKIIEDYPERSRCLIYGVLPNKMPIHIVCEYYDYLRDKDEDILIITTYVPDPKEWIRGQLRKR